MKHEYLEFTNEDINAALAKMPSDQREVVAELADEQMLRYLPTVREACIPDCVNDMLVDAIIEELEPHIRNAIMSCTIGLRQYFEPFRNYRRIILEDKAGVSNEEHC